MIIYFIDRAVLDILILKKDYIYNLNKLELPRFVYPTISVGKIFDGWPFDSYCFGKIPAVIFEAFLTPSRLLILLRVRLE